MLGEVAAVDVDSNGNVFVFHRAGRVWSDPPPNDPITYSTVYRFEGSTGRLLGSWGGNRFVMPHGLTIDHENNVWLTDIALHQIFKFSHEGQLLLALGVPRVPGADREHFNMPTDVAVGLDGAFYVSDGYRNSRVVKFAADGRYLFEWGAKGTAPGQFDLPHGITLDRLGRVYVADRRNARIQIFDPAGEFLREWRGPAMGRPYAIALGETGSAFVADGGDQPETPPDRSRAVRLDSEGRVLETFGRFGNYDGQFRLAHDIAVASDGAVYVADAYGQRVQKFVPR